LRQLPCLGTMRLGWGLIIRKSIKKGGGNLTGHGLLERKRPIRPKGGKRGHLHDLKKKRKRGKKEKKELKIGGENVAIWQKDYGTRKE